MLWHTLPAGLTALCLATLIRTAQSTCYHPNGSPSNDIPCNPDTSVSMCCSSPTACLASGLCRSVSTNGTLPDRDKFIRATCTDMTWTSSVCPPFCVPKSGPSNATAFDLNLSQNDIHIRKCHNQNRTFSLDANFCCGFADEKAECCETPEASFKMSLVATSADTPVAINAADGSPQAWTPLPPSPAPSDSATTSSFASPKTPLIVAPSSASSDISSSATPTTADPGTSDSSAPSTNPPSSVSSPTASASSTPASRRPKSSTFAAAASAVGTALADSTSASSNSNSGWGNSGKSANSDSKPRPGPSKHSSPHLSTGAIVGIGLGVSLATAGLVTISVYVLARRRLYMKQKRKWEEQMKMTGGGAGGAAGPGMVAVQAQTADGKPAVVMLAGGQGPSPGTVRSLNDMAWEKRSESDFSELEKRLSATMTRSNETMELGGTEKPPPPVEPRGGRTVTWFARHSIYEMG